MATTFQEIVTRSKAQIEMSQSSYVEDTEWLEFSRDGYRQLYNLLSKKFEDYFSQPGAELVIGSDGTVDVYSDLQKLHGVDIKSTGRWVGLNPRTLRERNAGRSRVFRSLGYRLMSRKLYFFPSESASGQTVRLWYTPLCPKITALSESIPIEMEQWSEYLVLHNAIRAAMKEETDISALKALQDEIRFDIEEQAMTRSLENADGVEDVRQDEDGYGACEEEW
jgi:hypothetical protein